MNNSLDVSLLIYIVVLIVVIIFMYKLGCTIWASLLFGFIISLIILCCMYPLSKLNPWSTNSESNSSIYLLILILTPIYVILYALTLAYADKRICIKNTNNTNLYV